MKIGGGVLCTLDSSGTLTINTEELENGVADNSNKSPWYNYSIEDKHKITRVEIKGHISFKKDCSLYALFQSFKNCSLFNGLENLDISEVISIGFMFYNCRSLTEFDLSNFNTSNVLNMTNLLNYCSSLTSLNLNNFKTNNVTEMDCMFQNCKALKELDLSNFSLRNITSEKDITNMLYGLNNLETIITPYQFDSSNLFQNEFIARFNGKLKECDTGELVNASTTIKPNFIYTKNETFISNTRELCSNIFNKLN